MKYILTYTIAAISILMLGCNESYPVMYMEEPTPDVIHAENNENGQVPIIPTLTEPQYDILTRGTGVFEPFEIDKEKWKNAKFHTYAFLGSNIFSQSDPQASIDYHHSNDTTKYLLWDQIMKITNDDMNVQFYDANDNLVTRYYNWQHQNWKYNFFTFYADDLDVSGATVPSNNNKELEVTFDIDGTQDIMHAVGYHTKEELDYALNKLTSEEDKPLQQYRNELLYSTMSGHRGIHPNFSINHLLTRLDFRIKGANPKNSNDNTTINTYQKIIVKELVVTIPTHATLTIAKDEWSDSTVYKTDLKNNKVISFSEPMKDLQLDMFYKPAHEYFPWLVNDDTYMAKYGNNEPQFHLSTTEDLALGKAILLPPSDMFVVQIKTDMMDLAAEGDSLVGSKIKNMGEITYNVRNPNGSFEAGHAYTVIISVYGPQNIEGSVSSSRWIGREDKGGGTFEPSEDHIITVGEDGEEEDNGK